MIVHRSEEVKPIDDVLQTSDTISRPIRIETQVYRENFVSRGPIGVCAQSFAHAWEKKDGSL
jgi:hypothetical protein